MERTPNYIRVWFWPRNAGNVPAEVKNGAGSFGSTAGWVRRILDIVYLTLTFALRERQLPTSQTPTATFRNSSKSITSSST